ncbi:MAG: hypothetical protein R6U32_04195 [Candidatus Woesearchaeota archaeon]
MPCKTECPAMAEYSFSKAPLIGSVFSTTPNKSFPRGAFLILQHNPLQTLLTFSGGIIKALPQIKLIENFDLGEKFSRLKI